MKHLAAISFLVASGTVDANGERWCRSIELVRTGKAEIFTANDLPNDGPLFKHRRYDRTGSYRVFVKADGRVLRCLVTVSSGEKALDNSGCINVKRRIRFNSLDDPACADVVRIAEYEIRFAWDHDVNGAEQLTGIRQLR